MEIIGPRGKFVDQPGSGSRTATTIGPLRMAQDFLGNRLRRTILPPTILGQSADTGDSLLLLTDNGLNTFITTGSANISAQEDSVGFMFGTALDVPTEDYIRGLFQDGKERTLIGKDQTRLGDRLFILSEGINYFVGDEVIANIHEAAFLGQVIEILDTPEDVARVRVDPPEYLDMDIDDFVNVPFDDSVQIVDMPFRHMVLRGPGLDIKQIDSCYNVVDVVPEPAPETFGRNWINLLLE